MDSPKSILIVEDHADTAEMLTLVLQSEGFRTKWVQSGRAAYDVFSTPEGAMTDLILLDLGLPDMSGDEAILKLIRNKTRVPPVLIISARPLTSIEQAAESIGAAGIVRKPFDIDDLIASIHNTIEREP